MSVMFLVFAKLIFRCVSKKVSSFLFVLTFFFPDGRKPSVAAIQGLALGGGLELTMVCHFLLAYVAAMIAISIFPNAYLVGTFCMIFF